MRGRGIAYRDLAEVDGGILEADGDITLQIETNIKYAGYIEKQQKQVEAAAGLESKIPADIDYRQISGLRLEAREAKRYQTPKCGSSVADIGGDPGRHFGAAGVPGGAAQEIVWGRTAGAPRRGYREWPRQTFWCCRT